MYIEYNPNPAGRRGGVCSVRAVAKALDVGWEKAYALMADETCLAGISRLPHPEGTMVELSCREPALEAEILACVIAAELINSYK